MGRQFLPLTVDRLPMLVEPCDACLFWESTPAQSLLPVCEPLEVKRAWLRGVLEEWGSAGRLALVDGTPAGFVTYAPAHLVPRAMAFPTAPVSEDAVALITARIAGEYTGQGLGKALLQRAARDVLRRGIRAIEVFATTAPPKPKRFSLGSRAHTPEQRPRATGSTQRGTVSRDTLSSIPGTRENGNVRGDWGDGGEGIDANGRHSGHGRSGVLGQSPPATVLDPGRAGEQRGARGLPLGATAVGAAAGALLWTQTQVGDDDRGTRPCAGDSSPAGGCEGHPDILRQDDEGLPNARGPQHCLLPVDFLTAVGFYPVREHPVYPRMRLDLRTALRWREELGLALERLFTRPVGGRRPVGTVN